MRPEDEDIRRWEDGAMFIKIDQVMHACTGPGFVMVDGKTGTAKLTTSSGCFPWFDSRS